MTDCVFCKIVAGEIPAAKVFEDKDTLAFFDINPLTKGHCLIIPKKHYEDIFSLPFEELKTLIVKAKNLAQQLKKSLSAQGINLLHASGKAAEQSVFHFHLHLVPRYEDDQLEFGQWWQTKVKPVDPSELRELAEKVELIMEEIES